MKNYAQCFAANLKRLRKERKMTQRELATAAGYSEKTVSKWESAAAIPEIGSLFRLAAILHTNVESLFADAESWYLGIDGGGTKTALALADATGHIVDTLYTDCCNPNDIGLDRAKEILADAIYQLCRNVRLSQVTMYAGIAGGGTGYMQDALRSFFQTFGFARFENSTDNNNIIAAGLGTCDGISVIMGTGICVWAKCGKETKRVGGWGYLLDEGGSAYNIGRDALTAYYRAYDGSGTETLLTEMIAAQCSPDTPATLLNRIYSEGKKYVASFSPLVFAAAEKGDSAAEAILERNFAYAADLIRVAAQTFPQTIRADTDHSDRVPDKLDRVLDKLDREPSNTIKVILAGGITNQPSCLPRLTAALADPRLDLQLLPCEPVEGALQLAMTM